MSLQNLYLALNQREPNYKKILDEFIEKSISQWTYQPAKSYYKQLSYIFGAPVSVSNDIYGTAFWFGIAPFSEIAVENQPISDSRGQCVFFYMFVRYYVPDDLIGTIHRINEGVLYRNLNDDLGSLTERWERNLAIIYVTQKVVEDRMTVEQARLSIDKIQKKLEQSAKEVSMILQKIGEANRRNALKYPNRYKDSDNKCVAK